MTGSPEDPQNEMTSNGWSDAERAALARLGGAAPPAELEDSVVSALRAQGLVAHRASDAGGPRRMRNPRVPARRGLAWAGLALAACAAAFYAGREVSERGAGRIGAGIEPPPAAIGTGRYMLLLYEDEAYRDPATPSEGQARAAEYGAWAARVRARGVSIEGEELAPGAESRTLDGSAGAIAETAGVPASAAGVVAGYFLIEASDIAAAAAVARTMPHLQYGGTVVIRPVASH